MLDTILDDPLNKWLTESSEDTQIVMSSRIRLARNFQEIMFPNQEKESDLAKVDMMMNGVLADLRSNFGQGFSKINLDQLSDLEREILVEKHLISPNLGQKLPHRSLVISEDASIAIMVNEEDHIRIQSLKAGFQLSQTYKDAIKVDDTIEGKYTYAFSENFGYLTACPTNVGTGLRASVMIHLPALTITNRITRIIRNILQLGYTVRGLYGEGTEALGNVYQVSNQRTMGISEEETIKQLTKVIEGLVKQELRCREDIKERNLDLFEDRVWRAYGILTNARCLSGKEALALLSDVQLGMDMNMLPKGDKHLFSRLIVITRPNFLAKYAGQEDMDQLSRDRYRAKVVRDVLLSHNKV